MIPLPAFGGGVFIADTSAWERSGAPAVAEEWGAALEAGQIAVCAPVMLELLYSARDGAAFDEVESGLRRLRDVPLTRSVTQTAISALRGLAHQRPLAAPPGSLG